MMKRLALFFLIISLCLTVKRAYGTHVVGGELMYEHVSLDTYIVRLILFIDCQNGNPQAIAEDQYACIGIFDGKDSSFLDSFFMERTPPQRINLVSYSCIVPPSGACVDKYEYETKITLPDSNNGFILSYERCCRNKTITNLVNPESVGSTFFTRILPDSVLTDNSSPYFKNLPPNFVCVNMDLYFDHSAKDLDGDSLVYGFYTPYEFPGGPPNPRPWPPSKPPYPLVPWLSPYSLANPLGTKSTLTIDAQTGLLHMKPTIIGQFVVGIIVKEFRKGRQIGETRRDYQFNVMPCQLTVKAYFETDSIYCDKTVQFDNKHVGKSFLWDFGVPGIDSDTSSEIAPSYTYPANGTYLVKLLAKDGSCVDTFNKAITILDKNGYRFAMKDTTFCGPAVLKLKLGEKPSKLFTYSWSPAEGLDSPNIANPTATINRTTTFLVKKIYKNCVYRDSFTVHVLSPSGDHFALPDTQLCYGQSVNIGEIDSSGEFTYSWSPSTWLDRADIPNPLSHPLQDVTYVVTKTSKNCFFQDTVRIEVNRAEAHFKTDSFFCRSDVDFTSNSIGSHFFWDFGVKDTDDDTSNEASPRFIFPKVGLYTVTHVAIDGHCTDTVRQTIKILKKTGKGFAIPDTAICYGQKIRVGEADTSGGFIYNWTPSTYLNNSTIGNPISTPLADITYLVTKSYDACVSTDTVNIHVMHPVAGFTYSVEQDCAENEVQFVNTSEGADTYQWFIKDSLVATQPSPRFTFASGMQVNGYLIASEKGKCPSRSDFNIKLPTLEELGIFIPNVITPNGDGANDCFVVMSFKNSKKVCKPEELHIYNRWGEQVFSNPNGCWDGTDERNGNKLKPGVYYYVIRYSGKEYKGTITLISS